MNSKYIFLSFCFALLVACSNRPIELSGVDSRARLDSVIALLPADSVVVDSLVHRQLNITMYGNFLYCGYPIQSASYTLHYEELDALSIYNTDGGYKSILASLEKQMGKGLFNDNKFRWENPTADIELLTSYSIPSLLAVTDSLDGMINVKFYPRVDNKIANIYQEVETHEADIYYLVFSSNKNTVVYVNNMPVTFDPNLEKVAINTLLVPGGVQNMYIKVLADSNNDDYDSYWSYYDESQLVIYREDQYKRTTPVKKMTIKDLKDGAKYDFKLEKEIETPILPVAKVDLSKDPTLKERLYAEYQKLYNAFLVKDEAAITEFIYPQQKALSMTYGTTERLSLRYYYMLKLLIADMQYVRLVDLAKTEVVLSRDGMRAQLRASDSDKSLFYVYDYSQGEVSYNFYFYQDDSGNLKVCL